MSDLQTAADALYVLQRGGISLKVVGGHLFASREPEASERALIERHREGLLLLVGMVVEMYDLNCTDVEYGTERLRFAPFWCSCGAMHKASDKSTTHRCPICGKKAKREMTYPRRKKRDHGRADGVTRDAN